MEQNLYQCLIYEKDNSETEKESSPEANKKILYSKIRLEQEEKEMEKREKEFYSILYIAFEKNKNTLIFLKN